MEFFTKDQVYSGQTNSERIIGKQDHLHFMYRACFDSAFLINDYLIAHSSF